MSLVRALEELYGQPAAFLKRLRSELLLHQRSIYSLAKEADMDYEHVKKYFAGRRVPRWETMARLDEAAGRLIDNG